MINFLKINNLSKKIYNNKILKNITLEVDSGEIVTILGKNGAGKTTLLNCILKLIKFEKGEILFCNKNIYEYSNKEYFNNISAVLESSENVYYFMTGKENIEYFGGLYGLDKKTVFNNIDYLIDEFDLRESMNKKVAYYSRGMIQKLAIIISMIINVKILILDEPTLGLDIFSKRKMLDILKKMSKEKGISIILTTHQMDIIEYLNERVIILEQGILKYDGSVKELKNINLKNVYILKYLKNSQYFEEEKEFFNFNEITQYLKDKNIKEIIEVTKKDKNLEQLFLELEL
jgi:ABC transporter related protein